METSLQLQRPLRSSGSPSSPLSLRPCPPPVSPQPGQAHLGNPRSPFVKAERWSPVPASLRPLWALSLPSLLAPGPLQSVQQEAACSQPDLPTQHTPHSTRDCGDQGCSPGPAAGSSLPEPWLDPPRWASAEKSQACPPATGHSEAPSRDTWTRRPLSVGSCRTGHPTVYFVETK